MHTPHTYSINKFKIFVVVYLQLLQNIYKKHPIQYVVKMHNKRYRKVIFIVLSHLFLDLTRRLMVLIYITDPPHNTETLHIPVHSSLNGADLGKDGRREVPLAGKCPQWIIITRGFCPLC